MSVSFRHKMTSSNTQQTELLKGELVNVLKQMKNRLNKKISQIENLQVKTVKYPKIKPL